MDFNKLIARVKNILLTPKTEWPVIDAEPETIAGLYKNYILILAAVPSVAMFIKSSILGSGMFGVSYHVGIGRGLTQMVVGYALTLGLVYVAALIADGFAPTFGAQKSQTQALKAVTYSWTATWIAGIGMLLGLGLGSLLILAGFVYAIYLLNRGLQQTMKCPADKATGYTAVTVILTVIVAVVVNSLILVPIGLSAYGGANRFGASDGTVTVDKTGALGALAAIGQKAAEAGKKIEDAQKTGDANAQGKAAGEAAGQILGAVLGGGDSVEALAPDALKPFVPDTLGGMPRTSIEVERNAPIGIQVSNAKATYRNPQGGAELRLEITDTGGAKGVMALAGFAGMEQDKQTDHGYEKTYHQDGRMVHEEWDNGGSGEFTVVLGDRFVVQVHGSGVPNIEAVKAAVGALNLSGLEALKGQGVKKG
ncbi:MAG TPA: Yip1 family protein [Rudaea sp.]